VVFLSNCSISLSYLSLRIRGRSSAAAVHASP